MRLADIEVPNSPIDRNSKGEAACYPQRTFYSLSMALPHRTTGSLQPTFVPVRPVGLTVKQTSAITLHRETLSISLSLPLRTPVTLQEATAPVKLPIIRCLLLRRISLIEPTGRYFIGTYASAGTGASKFPPRLRSREIKAVYNYSKGVWGLSVQSQGIPHLHGKFKFTESILETARESLCHSCGTELTRQGISLPQDRQSYSRRLPGVRFKACDSSSWRSGTGQASDPILRLSTQQSPVFLLNSRSPRLSTTTSSEGVLLIPKLQSHFAEFLQYCSLIRLSILYHSTCVGLQYGSFLLFFLARFKDLTFLLYTKSSS